MKDSKKALESEMAKIIADKAEKAISAEPDLTWWSILLESFYGWSPPQTDEIVYAKPFNYRRF